jgi:hypothetical protein
VTSVCGVMLTAMCCRSALCQAHLWAYLPFRTRPPYSSGVETLAEAEGAGLIEVRVVTGTSRVGFSLIYKRLFGLRWSR